MAAQVAWDKMATPEREKAGRTYDWGCPLEGKWVMDRYEVGDQPLQCKEDLDCVCIKKAFPESKTHRHDGIETFHLMGDDQNGAIVLPNYTMWKMPDSEGVDVLDPE
eukprot:5802659-Amphidinium_carterae.1